VTGSAALVSDILQILVMGLQAGMFRAGSEEIRLATVALTADEGQRVETWRSGAMVAVTIVAGGRRKVFLFKHGGRMNALAPAGVLVDRKRTTVWQKIARHLAAIGVAPTAGLRDLCRVHRGVGIRGVSDAVYTMAVDAGSDSAVACPQSSTMLTGPVFLFLVDPGIRTESLHERRIGVATSAKGRDLEPCRNALIRVRSVFSIHRCIHVLDQCRVGVATVTVVT